LFAQNCRRISCGDGFSKGPFFSPIPSFFCGPGSHPWLFFSSSCRCVGIAGSPHAGPIQPRVGPAGRSGSTGQGPGLEPRLVMRVTTGGGSRGFPYGRPRKGAQNRLPRHASRPWSIERSPGSLRKNVVFCSFRRPSMGDTRDSWSGESIRTFRRFAGREPDGGRHGNEGEPSRRKAGRSSHAG
jgi:hypothetical protein